MSNVVSETVRLLGGNLPAAELCGVSPQAVSNWKADGFIPERHHYRIFTAAGAKELQLPSGWNAVPERDRNAEPKKDAAA